MLETYYIHLEFKNKKGAWSINLPFVCDKCGVCCTLEDFLNAGKIHGSPKQNPDAYAKFNSLKDELGRLFEESEEKYEAHIAATKCPFQTGSICSIYAIRPDGCRQFPNTPFGMLSEDCKALDRFKKQRLALKKGRASKETGHFTTDMIKAPNFSEGQFTSCLDKLRRVGITDDELTLFYALNKQ
ncbi:MAG: YkgJ family cysteine cluster protein [Candidatus Bathyarchaeia archaeon]|jgi:Fe-S-cluster containining protein